MSTRRSTMQSLAILTLFGVMSIVCILRLPALTGSGNSPNLSRMFDKGETGTTLDSARATLNAAPLGTLEPTPNLLPAGTVTVTLSLTTTAYADCRWSDQPGTLYANMPHSFQQGQGTTLHDTVVTGLYNLADRRFYVRCHDLSTGRNPDGDERQTHLRVLGPWNGGYPRIANLWSTYDSGHGDSFFAGYDLFVPYALDSPANNTASIRAINPNAKILHYQYATKCRPESNPLMAKWWNSRPGAPGYDCLLRDSRGNILLYDGSGSPMCNMTVSNCRTLIAQQNVNDFLSQQPDQGANLAYDGIYWDLLRGTISWLSDDIDSNLDGYPDDPHALDAAYQAGVEDFLTSVRARLPHVILIGNEAPEAYAQWLNGRFYEWHLRTILDGTGSLTWDTVVTEYRDWTSSSHTPRATFIESAPEALFSEKYENLDHMLPAMQAEVAASYQRMRYGLASALMGDGLFTFDYRSAHGYLGLWWYDEFGDPGDGRATTPSPRGYLGQPTGNPALLVDSLSTPNQVTNGDFEGGLNGWGWWVNRGAGADATLDVDAGGGVSGTAAAHIVVTSTVEPSSVRLYRRDIASVADQAYTLSFWARSDVTRTISAKISQQTPPGTHYGFRVQTLVTPEWQHYHLWDDASVTASDGQLDLQLGAQVGELWLDDVQFQAGALGVWARRFENGLAVINTTKEVQTAPLPGVYCKLIGSQAPLFQARVDDDAAQLSAGWSEQTAGYDQFGATVHVALAGTGANATYAPTLAYRGMYQVLAWVVPTTTQSSAVSVKIRHAQGVATVLLDETIGKVGWHRLGTYTFDAGKGGSAVLASTGSGTVVADAFKWVSIARYNDGLQVSQITLQPQDGIVLLSSCPKLDEKLYLPQIMYN